ncbi:histidine kinase [Pontibacter sp. 172403-2]|uniref:sensor histidine kinase n=1 Tax=Pontibacter rufus TaxID=2791028 RepID=UPI0018AF5663|nr:histidine kinase [Pontibacter sp. 172403-2]MBF9251683.1 histidine kinase [Pontibacter sp. 172403-2]
MSSLRIEWVYLGWALLWAMVQTIVLRQAGLNLPIAASDALLTNLLLAGGGYAVGTGLRFYQPGIKQSAYLLGWSLGLAVICTALFFWLTLKLFKGELAYLELVEATILVRVAFAWLTLLLMLLLSWLWFYNRAQQQAEERKAATEKMVREAELFNLRQQLQPHFLFNSLNSISALAGARPEQARKMIQQLSDFLRGTLRKDNQQLMALTDELQHLQLYLEIEKVRFGHRLNTVIDMEEASMAMRLPALLLQPVVENAIKFGLYDTTGDTTIKLRAGAEGNYLLISIENPYDPASLRPQQGTGFGLDSIRRRLYLLYARHDLLTTAQEGNLFITNLKIPQIP